MVKLSSSPSPMSIHRCLLCRRRDAVVSDSTLLQQKPFCAPPAPTKSLSMMALTLPILMFYSALHVFVKMPLSIFLFQFS